MRRGVESLTYTDGIPVNPVNLHLLDQNHKMQRESKTGRENVYNNGNLQQPVIPAISRDRDSWRCDVQMSNNVIRCLPIRVQRVIQYRIQVDIITKSSRNTCKKTTTSSSLIAVSVNRTLESEICMEIESETGRLRVL